jgi:hypothetical protein
LSIVDSSDKFDNYLREHLERVERRIGVILKVGKFLNNYLCESGQQINIL